MELKEENSHELAQVCAALDELTLKQVDLVDEQLVLMSKLGSLMTCGFIDMAKSRYISGEKTVSATQIPGEDSVIEAVTTVDRDCNNKLIVSRNKDITDPIRWFGVLVPGSLKQSQQAFQNVLNIAVEIVNIRREWLQSMSELEEQHKTLCSLKSST
ncbi:putative coiled-coil domain-containing protein 115-like [Daphnia sinensis]|uniref:Vacuolar ATPase assembly protein VMA22 n=1 Tax=Daphnia sinensis TaxID=1820382 RepID=A0AAD5L2R3_9CRUS|nr:putative coiled-coil domain-containing protein 115-like [Daphnia sinensis]